ncbi:MAG: Gfo/Idh/MocA family oxidoreductase [Armatimonadetes bacterium]|nr:Gfo/Idh/MocA family oxidoreductase [Armatimonadota bacterium]
MAIKVGVAGLRRGCGPLAVLKHHPLAEVTAVADLNADTRERVGEQYDVPRRLASFDDLLDAGLDAVVIATPAPFHATQAVAALEAGLHVLSEVPAAWDLAEAEALARAAHRAKAGYMFAENVNYFDRTLAWQQFIDAGHLGTIFYGEAEYVHDCASLMRNPDGSPTWRAGMPPIQYCTHSLGPLLAWTHDRCTSATALHTGSHCSDVGALDLEVGLFRTSSGAVFKVLCGFSLKREPGHHYYCVYGTRGMLESGRTGDSPDRGYLEDRAETIGPAPGVVPPLQRDAPPGAKLGGHGDSEWFMLDAWLRSIADGTPPPIDVDFGLDMTLPGICAHLSAELQGEPVAIPNSRDWR